MEAVRTQGVFDVVEAWTGVAPISCPWRAFYDELVRRVLNVYEAWDKGQLSIVEPSPSHRLLQGVMFYARMVNVCRGKQMEIEREQRRVEADRQRDSQRGGRVIRRRG